VSSSTSSSDALTAGVVGRPHGLDGSFHVSEPRAELLLEGLEVTVAGRARRILRRAGTDQRPIVRLEGVEGRDAASALSGERLVVERAAAPELGEEEWWPEDLRGCRVHDGGRVVGVVGGVAALPSCDVLEVEREGEARLLVPLVRDAVRSVDVEAREIEVDLAFLEGPG
jgi:16S rRNA processing protein RimM